MLKYLKSAFWHRETVPLLGSLPVNALALAAFAALGFGHPVFWWIGGALEAAFLYLLATSPRYRRLMDALESAPQRESAEDLLTSLRQSLSGEATARHERLRSRMLRVTDLYRDAENAYSLTSDHERRLEHLGWLHLKLLLARDQLLRSEAENPAHAVEQSLAALEKEIASGGSRSAQDSRAATLTILRERLETARQRSQRLEEVGADLTRIEHQVELVLEKATLHANPTEMSFTIDLATGSLDTTTLTESSARDEVQRMDDYFREMA